MTCFKCQFYFYHIKKLIKIKNKVLILWPNNVAPFFTKLTLDSFKKIKHWLTHMEKSNHFTEHNHRPRIQVHTCNCLEIFIIENTLCRHKNTCCGTVHSEWSTGPYVFRVYVVCKWASWCFFEMETHMDLVGPTWHWWQLARTTLVSKFWSLVNVVFSLMK